MPELQVLACPHCGANLTYTAEDGPTATCQFCGTTVVLPTAPPAPGMTASTVPPAFGQMLAGLPLDKLRELKQLVHSGKQPEAVALYREIFGVGLEDAVQAVNQLAAGTPITISTTIAGGSGDTSQATALAQVVALMQAGQKIEAIKLYRATFNAGLAEAKSAVEQLAAGQPVTVSVTRSAAAAPSPADDAAVIAWLQKGQKIQAIKLYREAHPEMGLKQAKDAVEQLEADLNLAPGSSANPAALAIVLATVIGLLILGAVVAFVLIAR